MAATGTRVTTYLPFLLLFVALLIALAFEFVNGFHDTANAVATVIYTRSLPAHIAAAPTGRRFIQPLPRLLRPPPRCSTSEPPAPER